ncbi:MAG TPA: SDR family NAD(P)-dependent oxidoreductase, partial [Acidimicrobiales bacterium]|nr:SDR family NAD(P)-dependent oxidoreductase [Acidimicrobiales bacterium]
MDERAQSGPGGRVAVVTGASSGIGAALARELARRGTDVALVARRAERLEWVLADCRPAAPGSRSYPADLSDPEGAARLALRIWDEMGPIDVLVNNAGIPMRRAVQRLTMDEVRRAMAVNYLSPVAMTLALLPRMLERRQGVVVNVSSLGGRLGIPHEAAYCGSKFALAGWSESMAADLAGTGVSVRLVLPGAIDTEIWDQPGNEDPLYAGPKEPPEGIAAAIADAVEGSRFEHYVPDLKPIVEAKTADVDAFLAGMAAMSEGTAD